MSWARMDDQMAFHPKIVDAGNAAVGLWARMIAWSAGHLTNGIIPGSVARLMGTQDEINRACTHRLIDHFGDDYRIHDYLKFNPSACEVKRQRDAMRKVRIAGGKTRISSKNSKNGRFTPAAQLVTVTSTHPDGCQITASSPIPSHPIPSGSDPDPNSGIQSKRELLGSREPKFDFDSVYALYPRKRGGTKGLQNCRKKVKTRVDFDALKSGVIAFAAEAKRLGTEQRFIPHFSAWTNQERWKDYKPSNKTPPSRSSPDPKPEETGVPWTEVFPGGLVAEFEKQGEKV